MKIRVFLVLSFLTLLLSPAIQSTADAQKSTAPAVPSKTGADAFLPEKFSKLPLSFEVNQGQSDPGVRFLSHGNGYSLFLTDSAAVLVLSRNDSSSIGAGHTSNPVPGTKPVVGDVLRMELTGAKSNLRVIGAQQLPGKANYFVGNDPAKWHSGVPTYAKVRYEDVSPGVDLVYYGNQRQLEYDFIVAPSSDPKQLRLHFAGAQHLSLTPAGDLTIKAKNGEIAFHKPVVYQLKDGRREPVEGRFRLLARNNVGFALGSYDHSRELVIDPALAYSTYLGGTGGDSGNAIAVDAAGDAYVVGGTTSTDFPVTAGAFQKVYKGFKNGQYLNNAFVAKFNPKGSALIYSTYLGGTTIDNLDGVYKGDVATGVAIDVAGNAYVTGYASSYNFPVTSNAFQKVNHANFIGGPISSNAFVTKLNPSGSTLVYSTYLGGGGNYSTVCCRAYYGDTAAGIAVDSAGNAYVAGTTISLDFPVTANAFQKVNNAATLAGFNLFITKFNPSGSALVYSTYLGGSGIINYDNPLSDTAGGIAIDSAGNASVTGTAYSRDFPVTGNAYQRVNNSFYYAPDQGGAGGSNAVITKLNPTGSALVYSTYLGGSMQDGGNAIALNAAGNAYIVGSASSPDFPVTSSAFQKIKTGVAAFVTELNTTGSALVYSTFLGGGVANSIALDAFSSAYVTGTTTATNFPVTADAFRKANHSQQLPYAYTGNGFVSKLDPTGSSLLYSSYIGGSANVTVDYGDTGNGIAVDWFGDAYIAGTTCSTDFPLAGAPFQAENKGTGCTAFVSKFIVNIVTGTTLTSDSNPQKAGVRVTFTAHVTPNIGSTIPSDSSLFSIDGTPQVIVPLDDTGHASFSTSALAAGRYVITAAYLGSATDSGSSDSLGQIIIGAPARIAVVSGTYQTGVEGSPFAQPLVVQVQDARGVPVPGAVITFSGAGLNFSGNPAMTNAEGRASVIAKATATGSLTATATTAGVSTPATFKLTATQPGP